MTMLKKKTDNDYTSPKDHAFLLEKFLIMHGDMNSTKYSGFNDLAIRSTKLFVKEIVKLHGKRMRTLNDDELYVYVLIMFTIINHSTYKLGINFEENSMVAYVATFADMDDSELSHNRERMFSNFVDDYNDFVQKHTVIAQRIGTICANYIIEPNIEQMDKVLKIFKLLIDSLVPYPLRS